MVSNHHPTIKVGLPIFSAVATKPPFQKEQNEIQTGG